MNNNDKLKMLNILSHNYYIANYFIDYMIVNTYTLQNQLAITLSYVASIK